MLVQANCSMPSAQRQKTRKQSNPPRWSDYTREFLKDWERLSRSGRYDMARLKHVMLLLIANDGPPGPEWRDHQLTGNWSDHRECHVGGDFLLIYLLRRAGTKENIVFVRAGTHSDLF